LGCDCNGLEEGVLKEKDVNTAGDSGDESDEESKGFVVASQYDPAPVSPLLLPNYHMLIARPQKWSKR
jgi:hypothetical protein